jgi:uncharacterized protein
MIGFGTILNTAAIIIGGFFGLVIGKRFNKKLNQAAMTALGLFVLVLGIHMSFESQNLMIVLLSLVMGAIIGELLKIDELLNKFSSFLEKKFTKKGNNNQFGKAFIICSLLYCVGPMLIVGSLQDGLTGDYKLLATKAVMDGITSILFVATVSIGAIFAAIPVFVLQMSLTVLAGFFKFLLTDSVIAEITGTGGVIIIGSALNLLGIKKIKLANLLPALIAAVILALII